MGRVLVSRDVLEAGVSIEHASGQEETMEVKVPPRDSGVIIYAAPDIATSLAKGTAGELARGAPAIGVSVRPGHSVDGSMLQRLAEHTGVDVYLVLEEPEVMGHR